MAFQDYGWKDETKSRLEDLQKSARVIEQKAEFRKREAEKVAAYERQKSSESSKK